MTYFLKLLTKSNFVLITVCVALASFQVQGAHPSLVITKDDVQKMRKALAEQGRIATEFKRLKSETSENQLNSQFDYQGQTDAFVGRLAVYLLQ